MLFSQNKVDNAACFLLYYVYRMKNKKTINMELTNKVGGSQSSLKDNTKNPFVMGEEGKVGLLEVLGWTPARGSLGLGLNSHSFLGEILL